MPWLRMIRLAPAVTTSSQLVLVAMLVWRREPAPPEVPEVPGVPEATVTPEALDAPVALEAPVEREAPAEREAAEAPVASNAPEAPEVAAVAAVDPGPEAAVADADSFAASSEEDCSEGAPCDPIEVSTWPFHDKGDTRLSEVREIDRYSCANQNESGPEVWYRVTIDTPGSLVAAIHENPRDGFDIDLHLLEAPTAEGCLTRGHRRLEAELEPGTYWLVLDTFVDRAGWSYAGPYDLTVTFTPGGA